MNNTYFQQQFYPQKLTVGFFEGWGNERDLLMQGVTKYVNVCMYREHMMRPVGVRGL